MDILLFHQWMWPIILRIKRLLWFVYTSDRVVVENPAWSSISLDLGVPISRRPFLPMSDQIIDLIVVTLQLTNTIFVWTLVNWTRQSTSCLTFDDAIHTTLHYLNPPCSLLTLLPSSISFNTTNLNSLITPTHNVRRSTRSLKPRDKAKGWWYSRCSIQGVSLLRSLLSHSLSCQSTRPRLDYPMSCTRGMYAHGC